MLQHTIAPQQSPTRAAWRIATDLMTAESLPPGEAPDWIKIFPIGEWDHPLHGRWVVDDAFCRQVVENHNARVTGIDIALDLHHENTAAPGWIARLEYREDGVWAQVRWTPFGENLVKSGEYRYVSPEWYWDFVRPSDGVHFSNVLTGLALTNDPFFTSLPALVALAENPRIIAPAGTTAQRGGTPMPQPQQGQVMTFEACLAELNRLAQEKVTASGGTLSLSDAALQVALEHPDLRTNHSGPAPSRSAQAEADFNRRLAELQHLAHEKITASGGKLSMGDATMQAALERPDLR